MECPVLPEVWRRCFQYLRVRPTNGHPNPPIRTVQIQMSAMPSATMVGRVGSVKPGGQGVPCLLCCKGALHLVPHGGPSR
eukprot:5066261-Prymnesium_polylepis.1